MSSAVIKAGDVANLTGGLYSLDLRDISRQAEEILDAARASADKILADARRRIESERPAVHQAARAAGREEGLAEGRAAGEEAALAEARERFKTEQAALVSSLTSALETFANRREQMYLAARRDVVILAIAIARRILDKLDGVEDALPQAAVDACAEALELLREATDAVVCTHPDDLAAIQRFAKTLADTAHSTRHVRIVEDASVGRGGVIVRTADATINAKAASRVDRIADELVSDWRDRLKALSLES